MLFTKESKFMKTITDFFQRLWDNHPLRSILILAFALRFVSSIFSGGYGMHDDHFLVIETAQSWVDGTDYNNWLPQSQLKDNPDREPRPDGHSLLYPGINFGFFYVLKAIGIEDFGFKMFLLRLFHALISLIVVYAGFQMGKILSDLKTAKFIGLLLAVFWWMPFFSVRNLVEVVAIPPIMIGLLWLLQNDKQEYKLWRTVAAAMIIGLAFSIRFQTSFMAAGVGLVFLFQRQWKDLFVFSGFYLLSIAIVQVGIDFFIWKRPFAELIEYVVYNMEHGSSYGVNDYSMYFLVLMGVLVPPISVLWFFGWLRGYRQSWVLWLPTIMFFLFHTIFPNKQERFIITIAPMVIVLGVLGWNEFMQKSAFWNKRQSLYRGFLTAFWILNLILIIPVSLTFTKRSRVASMEYLSDYKEEISSILIEDTNRSSVPFFPIAYLEKWVPVYNLPALPAEKTPDTNSKLRRATWNFEIQTPVFFKTNEVENPDFVLFMGNKNLKERVGNMEKYWDLVFVEEIKAGFVDRIMAAVNPVNVNESVYIYRTVKQNEKMRKPKCCS
jgi:hypothetical protein